MFAGSGPGKGILKGILKRILKGILKGILKAKLNEKNLGEQNHYVLWEKCSTSTKNITVLQKTRATTLQEPSRAPGRGGANPLAFNYLSKNPISKA